MTYSFAEVDVTLTVNANIGGNVGFISLNAPILLSKKDFFGKDGAITITPNPDTISGDDVSIDGIKLFSVSNDTSGTAAITVGDMSLAHNLLGTIFNLHKAGLLLRNISLRVEQRPLGDDERTIIYSGYRGSVKSFPSKGWGSKQNGNSFMLDFELVEAATTYPINFNALQ